MKVLFATSEATPFIKTGGLGDVAGALPGALLGQDLDVTLVLPAYPDALEHLDEVGEFSRLRLIGVADEVIVWSGAVSPLGLDVLLVDAPGLFDRPGNPYKDETGRDHADNAHRFATFCRAVVAIALGQARADWRPDIVHCNDWQTGLVPALLNMDWHRPATIFTIHNLAYQGLFPGDRFAELQLPDVLWSHQALEFHGQLALIKGGIAFADVVTTVSPTYADEICTPELGFGLDGLLRHRRDRLFGVLNGVDARTWDPHTDPLIPARYDAGTLARKADNKRVLQARLGLPEDPDALVFGHVGRLVAQKGADLILDALPEILADPQHHLALLGSGDAALEEALRRATDDYPQQVGVRIGYDETMAHLIEAGADCFLMPSRFEPCGLNQMYSLRYGTVPIVHRTGGLADTVVDTDHRTLMNGSATGFVFDEPTAEALVAAVARALEIRRRPAIWWEKLQRNGMRQDFSWEQGAKRYIELYHYAMDNPTRGIAAGA